MLIPPTSKLCGRRRSSKVTGGAWWIQNSSSITFEPELLELFGAPSILGGADVGAIVFAFGLGELFAQVGDPLSVTGPGW